MKKILIIVTIIFIKIISINTTYSLDETIKTKIEWIYTLFLKNIEKKYTQEKELKILISLDEKLLIIVNNKKISEKNREILTYLYQINNEKLNNDDTKKIINENIFNEEYNSKLNNEIKNYTISKNFNKISYNKDNIFLENWIWYYYKIIDYNYFVEPDNITINDLNHNWIYSNNTVLFYLDSKNLWFAKNAKKIKLINNNIIYWIENKYNFLLEIKDDKKYLETDYDNDFLELKKQTLLLTKWLTNNEKIKKIYNYILDNVSYTKIINFEDKKIFSWIELYNNKEWVCEWYTKLFMYMINFAWIWDSQIIRWHVINAPDFPNIWHAWIKIWNKYYDPTFDDPLWLTKTKSYEEYKYFGLPYDLFYSNRFTYEALPEYLKTKSLEYRETFIQNNLYNLANKYKNENYVLLKKSKFKIKYGYLPDENITISNFNKVIPLYEVKDNTLTKDWKKYFISKLYFYVIDDNILENLLEQIDYNLNWHYFLKWINPDSTYEYRLWYDLELQ